MPTNETTIDYYSAVTEEAGQAFLRGINQVIASIEGLNPPDIIEWIEENFDIRLEAYQKAPIRAQLIPGTETLISMIEQSGKTFCWEVVCIYKSLFMPGPSMIIYEDKKKAMSINEERLKPMFLQIEHFKSMRDNAPSRFLSQVYKLPGGWIDVQGAGTDITSKPRQYMYDDEIDTQPLTYDKQKTQCKNVRKRVRSYAIEDGRNNFNITWCGSFKRSFLNSTVWWLAAQTNLSFWYLRCLGCGELTINSTCHEVKYIVGTEPRWISVDQKVLRYDVIDNRYVKADSCRLVCPECDHSHVAADLKAMNADENQYIARYPDIDDKFSFIVGGLGSRINNLVKLCKSHLEYRQCKSLELRRDIMNSDFGLPIDPGRVSGNAQEKFESHCVERLRKASDFDYVLMVCDTQTQPFGWYWVVRGYNSRGSFYIDSGFCSVLREDRTIDKTETEEKVQELMYEQYTGHVPLFVIMDQGGHHAKKVKRICKAHKKVYQYKGEGEAGNDLTRYSPDKKQTRLILGKKKQLRDDLIYAIHKDDSSAWFLPDSGINPDYEQHILNVDPDTGEQILHDSICRKDYFDCEYMLMALEDRLGNADKGRIKKKLDLIRLEKLEAGEPAEVIDSMKVFESSDKKKKKVTLGASGSHGGGSSWIKNW